MDDNVAKEQFLSIPKLASILGISRIAVYKKVKKGEIKSIRIGRNYAISVDYIKENIVDLKEEVDVPATMDVEQAVTKMMDEFGDVFIGLGKQ